MAKSLQQSYYQLGFLIIGQVLLFGSLLLVPVAESKSLVRNQSFKEEAAKLREIHFKNEINNYDWDFAVAHGGNISLITLNKKQNPSSQQQDINNDADNNNNILSINEFQLPFPNNSLSSALHSMNHDPTHEHYNNHKKYFGQISFIASDLERQLIFYTHEYSIPVASASSGLSNVNLNSNSHKVHLYDLNVYNFVTNEATQLLQGLNKNASFDDLIYYNSTLYWTDSISKCIMKLSVYTPSKINALNYNSYISKLNEPQVVVNLSQIHTGRSISFDGLAIDPNTGYIYWSIWGSPIPPGFSIQYFNGSSVQILLSQNIAHPTGLIITFDSYLYWINKPTGSPYTIEKVKLNSNTNDAINRTTIYTGQNNFLFGLNVPCSNEQHLYVTDSKSKSLLSLNTKNGKSNVLKQYGNSIPHGLISKSSSWFTSNGLCTANEENKQKGDNPLVESLPIILESHAIKNTNDVANNNTAKNNTTMNTNENEVPSSSIQVKSPLSVPSHNSNNMGPINTKNSQQLIFYSCLNYCSNGGTCIAFDSTKLFCLCDLEWMGPTCEIKSTTNQIDNKGLVAFNSSNSHHQELLQEHYTDHPTTVYEYYDSTILISLGIVISCLVLLIVVLIFKIYLLSRKPKIRRRVIVSRGRGPADEQGSGSRNTVCELIDVENCCNMSVCETPCYETGLLLGNDNSGAGNNLSSNGSLAHDECSIIFDGVIEKKKVHKHQDKEKLID